MYRRLIYLIGQLTSFATAAPLQEQHDLTPMPEQGRLIGCSSSILPANQLRNQRRDPPNRWPYYLDNNPYVLPQRNPPYPYDEPKLPPEFSGAWDQGNMYTVYSSDCDCPLRSDIFKHCTEHAHREVFDGRCMTTAEPARALRVHDTHLSMQYKLMCTSFAGLNCTGEKHGWTLLDNVTCMSAFRYQVKRAKDDGAGYTNDTFMVDGSTYSTPPPPPPTTTTTTSTTTTDGAEGAATPLPLWYRSFLCHHYKGRPPPAGA